MFFSFDSEQLGLRISCQLRLALSLHQLFASGPVDADDTVH